MKGSTIICVMASALVLGLAGAERKNWVLLIAGSFGYHNYRHQASVCHAYQIARGNGIPEEQIVLMLYDDIAYHNYNPFPGNIINQPDGPNVYEGIVKDYTDFDVNADVFLAVLQGDKELVKKLTGKDNPKVIESGPEDYVFINYCDHGGDGLLSMPLGESLYASELNNVLQSLHDQKRYAKLVFYTEACMSGSIWDGLLPDDIKVYTTTSAKPGQCSYACYYDDERDAYLASYYGSNWMENCDNEDISVYTLEEQYQAVKANVNTSDVMQYGDQSFSSLPVGEFVGNGKINERRSGKKKLSFNDFDTSLTPDEVRIFTLEQLLKDPRVADRQLELQAELEEQLWLRSETTSFLSCLTETALPNEDVDWVLNTHPQIQQRSAYESAVKHLMAVCPRLRTSVNDFILTRLNTMVNLSNSLSLDHVLGAIDMVSQKSPLCY